MSEQSAVEALKPCPHCGSDKIKTDYIRDGRVCGCCSCGASTRAYNPDAEVKAVQLWNTRALQADGRPTPREGERPENPSLKAHINLVADKYRPLVNAEAGLRSARYDVDLLPEQLLHVLDVNPDAAAPNANRFMLICELWKLAHPPATPAPKASSEAEIERVERVKRAIMAASVPHTNETTRSLGYYASVGIDALKHDHDRFDTLVDLAARAAIEAMREPTEAMESAAWGSCDVWRAMIDAALTSDPVAP
mgnify:CR=1 FL=1